MYLSKRALVVIPEWAVSFGCVLIDLLAPKTKPAPLRAQYTQSDRGQHNPEANGDRSSSSRSRSQGIELFPGGPFFLEPFPFHKKTAFRALITPHPSHSKRRKYHLSVKHVFLATGRETLSTVFERPAFHHRWWFLFSRAFRPRDQRRAN